MIEGTAPFAKYHGLGNDFLLFDLRDLSASEIAVQIRKLRAHAPSLCDRRRGVGGDGILLITSPSNSEAVARMEVVNADGSHAQMCGNGLRCVAKYLLKETNDLTVSDIAIETDAGTLHCAGTWSDDDIATIAVQMGRPIVERSQIPMLGPHGQCIEEDLALGTLPSVRVTAVSMGNPHVIVFCGDKTGSELLQMATELGPRIETHSLFPERANVSFVHPHSRSRFEVVVWERGCGITQACGTGACAVAVAACMTGRASVKEWLTVALLGGELALQVAEGLSNVTMKGPATHVFNGSVVLPNEKSRGS